MPGDNAQHFEVVVGDRSLGSVTQTDSGEWLARVFDHVRVGLYRSPTEARAAVVGWHEERARKPAEPARA